MANLQIKTVNPYYKNREVILINKKVKFNEDGIAEVDEELVDKILESYEDFVSIEDESKKEYRKQLLAMKKDEILQMAIDAQLPEEEYKDLNKEKLVDYLVSKI